MREFQVMRSFVAALAVCAAAGSASATTVAAGGTDTTGAGGFSLVGPGAVISSNLPGTYFSGATDPASEWVWSNIAGNPTFQFEFDLTGYDSADATLTGKWGVDNTGTVSLNGNTISSLLNPFSLGNFTVLTDFSTGNDSYFNAGLNVLTFAVANAGGPQGFRASVKVTVGDGAGPSPDMPVIPLPASLPLLAGAIALLGLGRAKLQKA